MNNNNEFKAYFLEPSLDQLILPKYTITLELTNIPHNQYAGIAIIPKFSQNDEKI